MKTLLLTFLRSSVVFFGLTLFASAASKEDISREIDTAPGGKLVVEVDFGSIDVAAGADNKVTLEAHRKIDFGSESKEKEYLASSPITLSKEGDVITIRSRGKREHWNFLGHCDMDAQYIVHVPKKFTPTLRTDGGTISVTDIAGDVKAHTSGGGMAFARLEGALDGETSGGAIEAEDCRGKIDIETSGGRIKVANGNGSLNAHTSGGSVEVRNFSGDTEVRTSGGGLFLEKIAGKLTGKTSGGGIRASIPGALVGDVKLETSAGGIELAVPASATFTIDAKTSVGEVVSKLPIQTTDANREHLRGTLNGGGKSVHLSTSAGNITISAPREVAQQ
jgi:DUF4097 and DUF4098 domain-containing protein YvlB